MHRGYFNFRTILPNYCCRVFFVFLFNGILFYVETRDTDEYFNFNTLFLK